MNSETPARILGYIDKCVRCGSCKALCPTYALRAIEPLSARGRVVLVGALIEGSVRPTQLLASRLSSCLLCGMCEGSCPVGVGITDVIYHGLRLLGSQDRARRGLRLAMGFAVRHPLMSFRAARLLKNAAGRIQRLAGIPFDLTLPPEPLSVGLEIFKPEKPAGRVAVFTGCAVNYFRPELGRRLIRALFHLGYEVVLPAGEVCCGAPLRALGQEQEAERLAKKNIEAFGRLNAEAVLSLCPTCTLALRRQYSDLAGEALDNAMDATEFILSKMKSSGFLPADGIEGKSLVYHAPCHLRYGLGAGGAPVEMLRELGLDVSVPSRHNCCGFSQNMADRGIASELLEDMKILYGGHDAVVTACPGCIEQLRLGHPNVLHAVECLSVPEPQ